MGNPWFYFFFLILPSVTALYSPTLEGSLRADLFQSYEKDTRSSAKVNIECNIKFLSIKDLNTREQTMSSVAYFTFTWTDDRLKWNHMLNYSSVIKAIYSTEDKLFIPSVVVENSVSNLGLISVPTLPIEIKSNGFILWIPGDIYKTSCDIDTTFYPFDKQTCIITLTTRGYSKDKLNLKLNTVPIVWSAKKDNGEWTVVTSSSWVATTDRDMISYSQVNFSFTFKRRTAFHLMNTIIPMFLLVSMTCFVFRIPVDAGEKLGYCLTVLLAFAVYLTLVSDNIPTTSTHISYISIFMNVMLALGVILTIHIINIYFKPEEEEIPLYLKFFAKITARIPCLNKERCCYKEGDNKVYDAVVENEDNKREIDAGNENIEDSLTWQEIAKKMDVLLFCVYSFLFISLTMGFIIIMAIGSSM